MRARIDATGADSNKRGDREIAEGVEMRITIVKVVLFAVLPTVSMADCAKLMELRVKDIAGGGSSFVTLVSNTSAGNVLYGEGHVSHDAGKGVLKGEVTVIKNSNANDGFTKQNLPGSFAKTQETLALSIEVKSGKVTLGNSIISGPKCMSAVDNKEGVVHGRAVPKSGGLGTALSTAYYVVSLHGTFHDPK